MKKITDITPYNINSSFFKYFYKTKEKIEYDFLVDSLKQELEVLGLTIRYTNTEYMPEFSKGRYISDTEYNYKFSVDVVFRINKDLVKNINSVKAMLQSITIFFKDREIDLFFESMNDIDTQTNESLIVVNYICKGNIYSGIYEIISHESMKNITSHDQLVMYKINKRQVDINVDVREIFTREQIDSYSKTFKGSDGYDQWYYPGAFKIQEGVIENPVILSIPKFTNTTIKIQYPENLHLYIRERI